nr:hypothetical protein [Tanacetum cinerariifolium]
MRKVNAFIAMDSEAQESSTKRTAEHLESDISKKQKSIIYYLLVENVYPLTRNTLHQLWSDVRLQVDHDVEMAKILIKKLEDSEDEYQG